MGFKVVIRGAAGQATPVVLADSPWPVGAHDIRWDGQRVVEAVALCQSPFQAIFDRKNRLRRFSFNSWRVFADEYAMSGWFLNHDDEVPSQGTVVVQMGGTSNKPGVIASYELAGAPSVSIQRVFGVAVFCRYELLLGKKLGGKAL